MDADKMYPTAEAAGRFAIFKIAFDVWMGKQFRQLPFERYADDAIVHCWTETRRKRCDRRSPHDRKKFRLELGEGSRELFLENFPGCLTRLVTTAA